MIDGLDGYPGGDAAQWRARYAPFVARQTVHRTVESPKLSVVVVAWNSTASLLSCLDALRAQKDIEAADLELILIDNGGLESLRAELGERIDVEIETTRNLGPGPARNLGIAVARAEIVAFVDDDGLVAPDFASRILRHFDDPTVVGVRGKVVWKDHRYFTTLASHYDRGAAALEDCLITEGNAAVRRDALIEVGGFAERLFGHEGIELTFRLKRAYPKGSVLYVPDVVLRHDYIDSWSKFYRKNFRYANVDDEVAGTDAGLKRFMDDYFGTRFPGPERSLDEHLALAALKGARTVLRTGARLRSWTDKMKGAR
jgi:glycosyltransferase involved in cell wall biosynthesis